MRGAVAVAALVAVAVLVAPRSTGLSGPLALHSARLELPPRRRGGRRGRRARAAAVAEALSVLDAVGPALRVGLPSATALAHLAQTSPSRGSLVHELVAVENGLGRHGVHPARASPIGQVWWSAAARSGAEELELVGAAWTLADVSGVALADAVDLAGRLLRESRSRQARLDVLLAGPRATMALLTMLPLAGPAVGLLFGIAPLRLYAGSPLSLLSAACGIALLVVGRLWCRALLRRALSAGPPSGAYRPAQGAVAGGASRPPQRGAHG